MKQAYLFLFFLFSTLPAFGDSTNNCTSIEDDDICISTAGCGLEEGEVFNTCVQCNRTQYSTANDSVCHDCIDSNGNWAEGVTRPMHSIFDINNTATGLSYCAWVCDNDWYKNDAGTGCVSCPDSTTAPAIYPDTNNIGDCSSCPSNLQLIHANNNKYYCGQCGAGTPTTQGGITTCSCFTGANHINGNMLSQGNIRVECLCPGIVENGQCVCPLNKYLHQDNNGVYSCESCPEHSTSAIGSTNVNDCQCDSDFPKRNLDKNNNLISCSACADNASFHNGSCQCNSGYYGDGTSSCKQCPIGTTTTIGATQRSDCKMNHNTKFCYGSGDNKKCMNLIPADTVISAPNNTQSH